MAKHLSNVLFVSKTNANRSLLAEACLNHISKGQFRAFSCGHPSFTSQQPNPWTLLTLKTAGISSAGLRSKGWQEFIRSGAAKMDFVITLDAGVSNEQPHWPGQPATALWDYPPMPNDSMAMGVATLQVLHSLRRRLEIFAALHAKRANRLDLTHDLRDLAHL